MKHIYAKAMRFIFRPVINGVLYSEQGYLLGKVQEIRACSDVINARLDKMEAENVIQSDFIHLLETQSQYSSDLITVCEQRITQCSETQLNALIQYTEFKQLINGVQSYELQTTQLLQDLQAQLKSLNQINEEKIIEQQGKQTKDICQLHDMILEFEEKTHNHIDFTYRDIMILLREQSDMWKKEVRIITDTPLALDSNDILVPHGTIRDNTRCPRFVKRCEDILKKNRGLKFLDLGCSGGGMVLEALLRGHYGLGLEGCDLSLIQQRAEWRLIPEHLKTCDITKPFEILDAESEEKILFDIISAWEVLEHIPQEAVSQLLKNIFHNLDERGIFVATVAAWPDIDPATGVNWHVNCAPFAWWQDMFEKAGFRLENELFTVYDLARGVYNPPHCYEKPYSFDESSLENNFYIVARKAISE